MSCSSIRSLSSSAWLNARTAPESVYGIRKSSVEIRSGVVSNSSLQDPAAHVDLHQVRAVLVETVLGEIRGIEFHFRRAAADRFTRRRSRRRRENSSTAARRRKNAISRARWSRLVLFRRALRYPSPAVSDARPAGGPIGNNIASRAHFTTFASLRRRGSSHLLRA